LSRIGNFGFISVSIFICLIITLVFGLTVCHTVATNSRINAILFPFTANVDK
jgi:hypothetical protein